MYFKAVKKLNIIDVDDDFAYLERVSPTGDASFVFFYRVSPLKAVKHSAVTVRVTVFSRSVPKKSILGDPVQLGEIDAKKLIKNMLTHVSVAKTAAKQQEQFNVAVKMSDMTSKINNEIIGQLRAGVPASEIPQLYKTVLKIMDVADLKENVDVKPILNHMAFSADTVTYNSSSLDADPKFLMHEMLLKDGLDPSSIVSLTHRSTTSSDSLAGTLRKSRKPEVHTSAQTKLLNLHLYKPAFSAIAKNTDKVEDGTHVHVAVIQPIENIAVPVRVMIPHHAMTLDSKVNTSFFVKFELIDGKTGSALDTLTRPLDVAKHMQVYNTPKVPPIVRQVRSETSTRVNLEIKQLDMGATAVEVYKKTLSRAMTEIEDYTLLGTYDVKSTDQTLLVPVSMHKYSTSVYRVVPIGQQSTQGFEFTNVVVRPQSFKPIKALSLTVRSADVGIIVEARRLPRHVTAIEFLVRNVSIHEHEFTNVGSDVVHIDDHMRASDYVSAIDTTARPGHVYEYAARLVYKSGTSELVTGVLYEFTRPSPGKVDTRIDNIEITQDDEPNVTFSINTTITDTNIDVIKTLLQRQDIFDMFADDVAKEREFIKNLIAHNVQRVDTVTGKREDFGVVTTDSFDDAVLRKNQSVDALKQGHRYRYEVTALLRAPETMFETLIKEKVDSVTKKPYAFKPAKFLHPITLDRGVIVSQQGLKVLYTKDAMSHGALGSVESIEVSFDDDPAHVIDPAAARFDAYTNIITWKLQGSIDQVDHFLIIKNTMGVRTLVGKAHSEFRLGNCQYVHRLTHRDEGAITYVIVPVYNDYSLGDEIMTNVVVVDDVPRNI